MNTRRIYIAVSAVLISLLAGCSGASVQSPSAAAFPSLQPTAVESANASAPLPELTEEAVLSDYLRYAALNNPGLEAAFNHWKAGLEQIPQAASLPDPRFTYQYYIEEVETRVGPQQQSLGLSQMFPWFGKLKLQGSIAAEAAEARRQRYEQQKARLFYEVQDAYSEYYYLGQAIRILEENVGLVGHLEEVSRQRYRTAATPASGVIKAQVELGRLEDQLRSLRALRGPQQARLNAALNRPADTPIPWPAELPIESPELSDELIIRRALDMNPALLAANHEILQNRHKIDLAKKQYYPDITLGLNYVDTADSSMRPAPRDSGKDPLMAMVSLNIPLWTSKYDAQVRQARAEYRAAQKSREDLTNTIVADLHKALYELSDAGRKINLYQETLIPKAVESLKVTEADYLTGKASFLELIDTQRVLLEFQLSLQRALADHRQSLARVEMLTGSRLPVRTNKADFER